jgi:large subunit ribosomal protein L29
MKASIIREMDSQDLAEAISEKEVTLTKMKIGHKVADVENPIEIRKTRRTIARMKTELRRRELEEASK